MTAGSEWDGVSQTAKKFVQNLLKRDRDIRFSADDALQDAYLAKVNRYTKDDIP